MNIYYKYKFYTMRHLQGILVTVCKFSSHVLDSKNGETVEDVIAIWVDWFSVSTSPIHTPHLITCRGIILVWHSDTLPPPQFSNTHEGHTQMEYVFVYAPAVVQYIIYHVLHNPGDIDGWGECLHFEQECIPIGCLPPEHNRMRGVSLTDPLDRDLPGQRSPWTETPPDRDPPW